MFENKTENNEQVTIQGCISGDQCMTNVYNAVTEIFAILVGIMVIETQKFINLGAL